MEIIKFVTSQDQVPANHQLVQPKTRLYEGHTYQVVGEHTQIFSGLERAARISLGILVTLGTLFIGLTSSSIRSLFAKEVKTSYLLSENNAPPANNNPLPANSNPLPENNIPPANNNPQTNSTQQLERSMSRNESDNLNIQDIIDLDYASIDGDSIKNIFIHSSDFARRQAAVSELPTDQLYHVIPYMTNPNGHWQFSYQQLVELDFSRIEMTPEIFENIFGKAGNNARIQPISSLSVDSLYHLYNSDTNKEYFVPWYWSYISPPQLQELDFSRFNMTQEIFKAIFGTRNNMQYRHRDNLRMLNSNQIDQLKHFFDLRHWDYAGKFNGYNPPANNNSLENANSPTNTNNTQPPKRPMTEEEANGLIENNISAFDFSTVSMSSDMFNKVFGDGHKVPVRWKLMHQLNTKSIESLQENFLDYHWYELGSHQLKLLDFSKITNIDPDVKQSLLLENLSNGSIN